MAPKSTPLDSAVEALADFGSLFSPRVVGECVVLQTPFTGPDFAPIEILIEWDDDNGSYSVTDGGYVADYFYLHDHSVEDDEDLHERISALARRIGAEVVSETIIASAGASGLSGAARRVLQVALSVPELWEAPGKQVRSPSFRSTVASQIVRMELPLSERFEIPGAVEPHEFDFGRDADGEVIGIQTFSATRRARALEKKKMLAWDVSDVMASGRPLQVALLVDDSSPRRRAAVDASVIEPLRSLFGRVMRWRDLREASFLPLRQFSEGLHHRTGVH